MVVSARKSLKIVRRYGRLDLCAFTENELLSLKNQMGEKKDRNKNTNNEL